MGRASEDGQRTYVTHRAHLALCECHNAPSSSQATGHDDNDRIIIGHKIILWNRRDLVRRAADEATTDALRRVNPMAEVKHLPQRQADRQTVPPLPPPPLPFTVALHRRRSSVVRSYAAIAAAVFPPSPSILGR